MPTLEESRELADSIAHVATGAGVPTVALITAMDQPLASAAGNAVEVRNAVEFLTGTRREARLGEVTVELGAEMLAVGGLVPDIVEGRSRIHAVLASGAAAETFARMVRALGGPSDLLDDPGRHLPRAKVVRAVAAAGEGRVASIDTRAVGLAVVALGGGRKRPHDGIDHSVGFTELAALGDVVGRERPLAIVHASSEEAAEAAAAALRAAYGIGDGADPLPAVLHKISA
jgi:thymidine phosphorylase